MFKDVRSGYKEARSSSEAARAPTTRRASGSVLAAVRAAAVDGVLSPNSLAESRAWQTYSWKLQCIVEPQKNCSSSQVRQLGSWSIWLAQSLGHVT